VDYGGLRNGLSGDSDGWVQYHVNLTGVRRPERHRAVPLRHGRGVRGARLVRR
jgi:hypothetical protein